MHLDIALVVPGMEVSADCLQTKSLGGSETAGLSMAFALAKLGHKVTLFGNTTAHSGHGVTFLPLSDWQHWHQSVPHDVAIVQRVPQFFGGAVRGASKINILWQHDLALKRQEQEFKGVLWNVDQVWLVSDWMREQYLRVYGGEPSTYWATRNGVDIEAIKAAPKQEPDRNLILYASRPERGLDVLLNEIMPEVWALRPAARLEFCTYNHTHPDMAQFYGDIARVAASHGNKVRNLGSLSKVDLYAKMKQAGAYAYPTPSPIMATFAEVSCIAAIEAMHCGLPFVTTGRGALKETLGGAGVCVPHTDDRKQWAKDFAATIIAALDGNIPASDERVNGFYSWDTIAQEWSARLFDMFRDRSNSPQRLAAHFYRTSDISALDELCERTGFDAEEYLTPYKFRETPEDLAAHYAAMSRDTDGWLGAQWNSGQINLARFRNTQEARFHMIESGIAARIKKAGRRLRVLDYGCGHGWMGVYMASRLDVDWVGWDMDDGARKWASLFITKYQTDDQPGVFSVADAPPDSQFDIVVCSEVMEHVPNYTALLEALEARCVDGGLVIMTTPYGPVEFGTHSWLGFRNHIHHFELADLREILKGKPDLFFHVTPEKRNDLLNEPCGFYLYGWAPDRKPFGKIDYERKLLVQSPRQTLSLNMLAGPGAEATMDGALERISQIADEIIIADAGLSDAGLTIAFAHGAKVVKVPPPTLAGFDTCRNKALDHSTGDWVLWVDTDEFATNISGLLRFLRPNSFDGYCISQVNFSVDAAIDTDLPVRCFRRVPEMRFHGLVHEHPEKGLNKGPGNVIALGDVKLGHIGYLEEGQRQRKFQRNLHHVFRNVQQQPDRLLNHFLLMRDLVQINNFELTKNGGRMTPNLVANAEKVVQVYRERFLGKPSYIGVDPKLYYSEANKMLGVGFDVEANVFVTKDGVGGNGIFGGRVPAKAYRYANEEDLRADLEQMIKDSTARFKEVEFW